MLHYFDIPFTFDDYAEKKLWADAVVPEINLYAEENNLKIVQIAPYGMKGLFVVFEKKSIDPDEKKREVKEK